MSTLQAIPAPHLPAWMLVPHLPVRHPSRRLLVAVASTDGTCVDRDFEDAEAFLLYEKDGDEACYIGRQPCPLAGAGATLQQRTRLLADCDLVLCASISEQCRQALGRLGIACNLACAGAPVRESVTDLPSAGAR